MNSDNKYTPKLICESNRRFNIPIYKQVFMGRVLVLGVGCLGLVMC